MFNGLKGKFGLAHLPGGGLTHGPRTAFGVKPGAPGEIQPATENGGSVWGHAVRGFTTAARHRLGARRAKENDGLGHRSAHMYRSTCGVRRLVAVWFGKRRRVAALHKLTRLG